MRKLLLLFVAAQAFADTPPFGYATSPGNSTTQYFSSDGRSQGTATRDGNTTRYYSNDGRYIGSTNKAQDGNTYYYGADGRSKGNSIGN